MRADGGFTLVEVLVAFVIAIVALTVLTHAGLDGLRGASVAGRYQEAMTRARSHLAAIGDAPVASDREGDEGDGYHWHVRIAPVATGAVATGHGRVTLLAVSVAVSWDRGATGDGAGRSVRLDSERLVFGVVGTPP